MAKIDKYIQGTRCSKRAFDTLHQAYSSVNFARKGTHLKKRNRITVNQRPYYCEFCGKYHLSTHSRKKYD